MLRLKIDAPETAQLTPEQAEEVRRKSKQAILAIGMLVAGSANTITCKMTLGIRSPATEGGEPKLFDHPFVMAGTMFFGECLCLLWFRAREAFCSRPRSQASRDKRLGKHLPFSAFALPACCDLVGTSVMYVGLTLTSASTYQMLRGSSIIFTALLSSYFLGRKQLGYHWVAMALVVCGVFTVGAASTLTLFTALQMCVEERFVTGYKLPALVAVGNEGIWGLTILTLSLFALQHINLQGKPMENSVEALHQACPYARVTLTTFYWSGIVQVIQTPKILPMALSNSLSIAFFNFFGMSITKHSSAAYRMMLVRERRCPKTPPEYSNHRVNTPSQREEALACACLRDSLRTLIIWLFDLASGGGTFHYLQCGAVVLGFRIISNDAGKRIVLRGDMNDCMVLPLIFLES
ncbi:MAG: hypothetical protein SGPRY_008133 [Prymnesium sp.]